jgi:DNA mismatch repair protein MutS
MTTTSRGGPPPSLLFADPPPPLERGEREDDRSYARDLNLDQVVAAVAGDREERELITETLYGHLRDADTVRYRQEVFRDLEDPALLGEIQRFADQMAEVGAHLRQLASMQYRYQREGWLLDAAAIYCAAVRSLAAHLALAPAQLTSRPLLAFRDYLADYAASAGFTGLARDTSDAKDALGRIRYCTRIRGDRVEVTRYDGEADYSAVVLNTFASSRARSGTTGSATGWSRG